MSAWNEDRYEREKRRFIGARMARAPLRMHFTVLFAVTWGAAWLCSWLLLHVVAPSHAWARMLPARYAIAFLFAYGCFFLAARIWMEIARELPESQSGAAELNDLFNYGSGGGDGDSCLLVIATLIIGFLVGTLFLAIGGAPMLLEAAFEAAFAGVVVTRPLRGKLVIGDWKGRLLANTWKPALGGFVALVGLAAFLHAKAPQAETFAQAVAALLDHGRAPAQR